MSATVRRGEPKRLNLGAVVVWYEPTATEQKNIHSYLSQVGHLWIVDNSSNVIRPNVASKLNKVTYIHFRRNLGIAAALNIGCEAAAAAGYDFVLTMDQDASFEDGDLETHLSTVKDIIAEPRVGAIGIAPEVSGQLGGRIIRQAETMITAGSLIQLTAWRKVQGFDQEFFIDQVDHEFSYKLKKSGYELVSTNQIKLNHQIGDPIQKKIFGISFSSSNHHWLRRYYFVRNSLYIRKRYPEFAKPFWLYLKDIRDHMIGIILLERNKLKKLTAMFIGYVHFRRGITGPWRGTLASFDTSSVFKVPR